jgi:hypothetical protein
LNPIPDLLYNIQKNNPKKFENGKFVKKLNYGIKRIFQSSGSSK